MHPIWDQEAAASERRARAIVMSAGDEHWDLGLSTVRTLLSLVPAGGRVCDLGCGVGRLLAPVSRERDDVWFTGIDGSPAMLRRCRDAVGPAVGLVPTDVAEVIRYGPFDLVYSMLVLHHLDREAQERTIRMAARSLNPGGYFSFTIVADRGDPGDVGPLSHPITVAEACEWVEVAAVRVTSIEGIDGFPTLRWIHARRKESRQEV